jgi:hypothetical protein
MPLLRRCGALRLVLRRPAGLRAVPALLRAHEHGAHAARRGARLEPAQAAAVAAGVAPAAGAERTVAQGGGSMSGMAAGLRELLARYRRLEEEMGLLNAELARRVGEGSAPRPEPEPVPQLGTPDVGVGAYWDERLTQRGMRFLPAPHSRWRLVSARYLEGAEAQGRHHVLIDVLDAGGRRLVGVAVLCYWADGQDTMRTEAKPGEPEALAFPLYAAGNGYGVQVEDGPRIEGMGLGTIAEPHVGHHVAYRLVFQRRG